MSGHADGLTDSVEPVRADRFVQQQPPIGGQALQRSAGHEERRTHPVGLENRKRRRHMAWVVIIERDRGKRPDVRRRGRILEAAQYLVKRDDVRHRPQRVELRGQERRRHDGDDHRRLCGHAVIDQDKRATAASGCCRGGLTHQWQPAQRIRTTQRQSSEQWMHHDTGHQPPGARSVRCTAPVPSEVSAQSNGAVDGERKVWIC